METNHQTQVLDHLKQGRTISPVEAINYYDCFRLSAVINRLRKQGYDIVTHQEANQNNKGTHARYELIGELAA